MPIQGAASLLATSLGRQGRSCSPGRPSAWQRASHLRTVRVLTSNAAATAATLQPSSSTRRTITARPKGVVRAFLWLFIRAGLRRLVIGRNHHLPGLSPDEQGPQKPQLAGRGGARGAGTDRDLDTQPGPKRAGLGKHPCRDLSGRRRSDGRRGSLAAPCRRERNRRTQWVYDCPTRRARSRWQRR
jgi:hypothetical protein